MFAPGGKPGRRFTVFFLIFAVVAAAVIVASHFELLGQPVVLVLIVGSAVASFFGLKAPPRRALQPAGAALRDQVVGFRSHIETAEANQLNFEANQDIYRRSLPWAVVFDLTERWTQVCQELVAAGRIPALDTSFWAGDGSATSMSRSVSSFSRSVTSVGLQRASGSGGSSGFSRGPRGGGGGGGARPWSW